MKCTSSAHDHSTVDTTHSTNLLKAPIHDSLNSLMTHLKFGCRNYTSLSHMSRTNCIDNMPTVKPPKHDCPVCLLVKGTKLPRQMKTTLVNLRPGQLFMCDFAFFNVTSIRGFKAYLSLTCQATGYSFSFPTRSKKPPLDLFLWFIETLERMGFVVNAFRFDEGGELARSTEVNRLLISKRILMETTGGYSSNLNGKDERQHRTNSEMVRVMLYLSGLDDSYWCLALSYATFLKRRWCSYPDIITPYERWHKTKPDFRKIHLFGAPVYVYEKEDKKLVHNNKVGIFLGYSTSTAVVLYRSMKNKEILRCHHARIDDAFQHPDSNSHFSKTPASILIRNNDFHTIQLPSSTSTLEYADSAFDLKELFTYQVQLPVTGPLGLLLENDRDFGLPLIVQMESNSNFVTGCKKVLTKNSWIVSVQYEEPITVERFLEYIEYLRSEKCFNVTVTLAKRPHPNTSAMYQEFRSRFDVLRPVTASAQIQSISRFAIQCPSRPVAPDTFKEFLHSPYKEYWIKAMFERFTKYYNAGTWSAPIPRSSLPPNATVLDAVSTFKIKTTDNPNMWDLYYRPCSNGGPMKKGLDYDQSHASPATHQSLRMLIAVSAKLRFRICTLDISNAFQSTPRYDSKRTPPIYMRVPPLYIEWFNMSFHKMKVDKNLGPYVVQLLVYMQGTPPASREFYILLAHILADINLYPTSIDNGVFALVEGDDMMFLAVETDDLLISTNSERLTTKVVTAIKSAFDITLQTGDVIKYLNYNIVQSTFGISMDQTAHILDLADTYLGKDNKYSSTATPLRSDRQFNEEMYLSVPATPSELKALEKEYGHKYSTVYGALLHVSTASRPDIANALNRLGVFQAGPNRLAFQSIFRVVKYLKCNPNVPLMYSSHPFTTSTVFESYLSIASPENRLVVPHCLCGHVDSSFAPYKESRHSITACLETIGTTAVGWRVTKQITCATSATDAETRAYYLESKRMKQMRMFLQQIGLLFRTPSPISTALTAGLEMPTPIYEDNKGCRDMIEANRVTSNLRHVEISFTYMHELHSEGVVTCLHCGSKLMFADTMTKQETGPKHTQGRNWFMGKRFYPPPSSAHYKHLTTLVPLK